LGGNDFNRALQLRGIWNTHWAPDPFVLRLCSSKLFGLERMGRIMFVCLIGFV